MYCEKCNNQVNKEDNYCMFCGNRIKKTEESKNNEIMTYIIPPLSILGIIEKSNDKNIITNNQTIIEEFLEKNKIIGKIEKYYNSPNFITYAISLKPGTKIDTISKRIKELANELNSPHVYLEIPIEKTNNLGIVVQKNEKQAISLKKLMQNNKNKKDYMIIPFGIDFLGNEYYYDLRQLQNIFINGSTGSGKSVCINNIIISILMKARPDEVKLVLIDPKKVELGMYTGVPHLLTPVVTDPKKASFALKKVVTEMERRYDLFEESQTKNIAGYNALIEKKNLRLPEDEQIPKMPYIVVIVDELSNLMPIAGKEIEDSIMRITQMACHVGIYLIVSTSIPKLIIKQIYECFQTIIDLNNKNNGLLLNLDGDMIIKNLGERNISKIQGAFISEEEIQKVVNYTITQQKASYDPYFTNLDNIDQDIKQNTIYNDKEEYDDPLYNDIVEFVIESQKASASLLQRRFKLGYNRATRMVDLLEERGVIGPQNGSKPREVLIKINIEEEN